MAGGGGILEGIFDGFDTLLAYLSSSMLKQTQSSYCDLQTADSDRALAANDGSLVSVIEIRGVTTLVGTNEFQYIHDGVLQSLQTALASEGHSLQFYFGYNKDIIEQEIEAHLEYAKASAEKLQLNLGDLIGERLSNLAEFCSTENVYLVVWTHPTLLSSEERARALKQKGLARKKVNYPLTRYTQDIMAAMPELRQAHDAFVDAVVADFGSMGIMVQCLEVHDALRAIRQSIDANFLDKNWKPVLPGDKYKPKIARSYTGDIGDLLWPSLPRQLFHRDAENLDLRTCKIGDRLYGGVFIDLFPKEVKAFSLLFNRLAAASIPWRISFMLSGGGMETLRLKRAIAGILVFSSAENRLIVDAGDLLEYIDTNMDDSVIKLQVAAVTWAPIGDTNLIANRMAQLARAIQSWGSCDVSEVCGDAYEGVVSSMLGVTCKSVSTATVASLSDVIYMLPIFRPNSPWRKGSLLFRSPDGKLWPYQPGSSLQTTWIDLIYARPGSGKSVLSNAMNLALCLSHGIQRLPRISIIDIGPSSSGLISLLKEALPPEQRHLVAYHRLRMTSEYAINVFDTQLGSRFPTPQDRSFLTNFITLLTTPIGADKPYDGMTDMIGLIIDEAYKQTADNSKPNLYSKGVEDMADAILEEIGFISDKSTTWWEVTDALFTAGFAHEAMLSQRHAVPQLADLTSICRSGAVVDLYGNVKASTSESLVDAFNRTISSAVREYPIISGVTQFDVGDSKILSLDLDEVAKGGGVAAERQTAIMYMLARFVVARNFYLDMQSLGKIPDIYRKHHEKRIAEIKDEPKRLVLDEFHRTSSAKSVRDQVVIDMREGRKWNVQVALLSQSLDDFDKHMVEFGTSIFIMDAGPEQAIQKTSKVFGLTETARVALRNYVRGPRIGGSTLLAQFATKEGMNTQLLTLTLGPIELWAFSTTTFDALLRNKLYDVLGPAEARRFLALLFPRGSATDYLEKRLETMKEESGMISEEASDSIVDELLGRIVKTYQDNPKARNLSPV